MLVRYLHCHDISLGLCYIHIVHLSPFSLPACLSIYQYTLYVAMIIMHVCVFAL